MSVARHDRDIDELFIIIAPSVFFIGPVVDYLQRLAYVTGAYFLEYVLRI